MVHSNNFVCFCAAVYFFITFFTDSTAWMVRNKKASANKGASQSGDGKTKGKKKKERKSKKSNTAGPKPKTQASPTTKTAKIAYRHNPSPPVNTAKEITSPPKKPVSPPRDPHTDVTVEMSQSIGIAPTQKIEGSPEKGSVDIKAEKRTRELKAKYEERYSRIQQNVRADDAYTRRETEKGVLRGEIAELDGDIRMWGTLMGSNLGMALDVFEKNDASYRKCLNEVEFKATHRWTEQDKYVKDNEEFARVLTRAIKGAKMTPNQHMVKLVRSTVLCVARRTVVIIQLISAYFRRLRGVPLPSPQFGFFKKATVAPGSGEYEGSPRVAEKEERRNSVEKEEMTDKTLEDM